MFIEFSFSFSFSLVNMSQFLALCNELRRMIPRRGSNEHFLVFLNFQRLYNQLINELTSVLTEFSTVRNILAHRVATKQQTDFNARQLRQTAHRRAEDLKSLDVSFWAAYGGIEVIRDLVQFLSNPSSSFLKNMKKEIPILEFKAVYTVVEVICYLILDPTAKADTQTLGSLADSLSAHQSAMSAG